MSETDLPIIEKKPETTETDRYDDPLTKVMVSLGADGAFLMIFGTEEQSGASFVAKDLETYSIIRQHMPGMLRKWADVFEQANQAAGLQAVKH